jgi:DNA-binding winged helix-turn-helix (wHTH) protein
MAVAGEVTRSFGARCYEFHEFRLEPSTRRLLRQGTPVALTPRAFDLLLALVENHHRVLPKDELLRRVWDDAIVEESNLTQQVFLLRKVLGDSQDDPRFIATIARRGYRFVGEVREAGPMPVVERFSGAGALPPGRGPGRARMLVAGALVLAGGAAAARVLWRPAAPLPPSFRPLTFQGQGLDRARFTPDGQSVVLDARWDGQANQLFVTPASDSALRPLGVNRAQVVQVSPGGDVAVLLDDSGASPAGDHLTLAKVPLGGGGPRRLVEGIQNADWAPDTDQFALVRRGAGRSRVEYPAGTPIYETAAWLEAVRISPDRERVAFLEHPLQNDTRGFVTVVDRQGRARALSREWGAVFGLVWTRGGELWFGRFDGRVYAVAATGLDGHERDVYRGPDGLILQDIASDGRALATRFTFRGGARWRPSGSATERKLAVFSVTRPCAMTPDGRGMLFTAEDQGPEWTTYATYFQTADASGPVRLGEGSAQGLSPDGRWALVVSLREPAHLVLLPVGVGEARALEPGPVDRIHKAQWLPDGRRVVFAGNEKGKGIRLYVQAVAGGAPEAITPEGYSLDPDGVSPDGRLVACLPEAGGVSLCPVDGGPSRSLRGVERDEKLVRWSEDGRLVFVYRRAAFPLRVYGVETRTGRRALFKEIAPPDAAALRNVPKLLMTADGAAYAYGYVITSNDLYLVEGLR